MNNLSTVLRFTILNKLRSKAFVVTSLIFVILVTIGVNVPFLISLFNTDKESNVGMLRDAAGIAERLGAHYEALEDTGLNIVLYESAGSAEADEEALRARLAEGEIGGYLVTSGNDPHGFPKLIYKSEDTMDFSTVNRLAEGLGQIKMALTVAELNLTAEQIAQINSPVQLDKVQISVGGGAGSVGEEGKTASEIALASGMVYVLIIMLFIAVMVSGQLIATEITAEKSSRVMEILVTSVKPLTQMFGKIIGIFLVGLTQILLLAAVVVINLRLPHNQSAFGGFNIDLSKIDPLLLVYALVFYLLGYLLYATLFAAVGSIVSRTEDLGQAIMPVSMLSMVGYFIAIYGVQAPNSVLVTVCSFIPFFSPFIMFLRIGTTDPAIWEVLLSLGLLAGAIMALGWLSAKIYRTGVLMYGKRPTFKELRKAMKAYKI